MKNVKSLITINATIDKTIRDDEYICEECHGLGFIIEYEDKCETIIKSIELCMHCYNGIATKCKYCGRQLLPHTICKCKEAQKNFEECTKRKNKELSEIMYHEATLLSLDEMGKKFFHLYIGELDKFVSFEYVKENYDYMKRYHIFGAFIKRFSLNANYIINDECDKEQLHDNAINSIININDLQNELDKWVKKNAAGANMLDFDFKYALKK